MLNYIEDFKKLIAVNPQAHKESAGRVRKYIEGSTAIYHGEPIKTLYIPKIFSAKAYAALKEAGKMTMGILNKVTDHYLNDPSYRALFPYPEGLSDLVCTDRGYGMHIPICRLDIFFNEEDFSFQFCEINTDGTSGMVEDLELNRALSQNAAFQEYAACHKLRSFELYHSFVNVFLNVWKDFCAQKGLADGLFPYVAIVDFLDGAYLSDFYHFKDAFEQAGCRCEICEITRMRYENGRLLSPEGHPVDAVYRRAVTTDIFANKEKIPAFLEAVTDGAVCCIGNFCTQVAHNKSLFKILRDPETKAFLSDEENRFVEAHFPFTGYLNTADTGTALSIQDVIADKDRFLLKPLDLYGAREISVGSDFSQEAWEKKVLQLADQGYIFQDYCTPFRTDNFALEEDTEVSSWINMTGLYMYGENLAGMFSRLAPDKVIAGHYGGRTLATLSEEDV